MTPTKPEDYLNARFKSPHGKRERALKAPEDALVERLCRTYEHGVDADEIVIADLDKGLAYRNPDGPAAADAITTLLEARKVDAARIDALYAELRKLRGKPTLGVVALNDTALTGDGV